MENRKSVLRHAEDDEERKFAQEQLEYCRSVGDSIGVMIYLNMLTPKEVSDEPSR
jgi:hypothetical protein